MNKNKILYIIVICLCLTLFCGGFVSAATTPKLVNKLNTALNKILSYLEKLAPAAASVAIVSGVMIRKFSFGDEEKLIMGKKIIVNAILGYRNNFTYRYNY